MDDVIVEQAVEQSNEVAEQVDIKEFNKVVAEKKTLEQSLSRQGYELGELRKVTDKILLSQITPKNSEPIDFFIEPEKAVDSRIANNPKMQEIEHLANTLKQQAMTATLKSEHPDFKEIINEQAFQDWISASKIRSKLFMEADNNYDVDAASELLSNWKERQQLHKTGEAEANVKNEQDKALKSAKVDTGTSASNNKKTYSRLDLMRLRTSDPDKYKALDVAELYKQGRVK